jgi:RimJ/RimL family protein N-acetyltransferase
VEGRRVRRRAVITPSTPRLSASRLDADDFDTLCALHRDPAVMAMIGGVRSDERTRAYLAANIEHWREHGFGLWIFRDPATRAFVGRGGLRHIVLEGQSEVEVAYALARDAWGKGYATEIARASLDVGFRLLGLQDIVAFALPENQASRRVMEKVGFAYERDIIHDHLKHVLYRIRATRP